MNIYSLVFTFIACLSLETFPLSSNPFAIDFPDKTNLTNEDYILIQNKLRAINIDPLLKELYGQNEGLTTLDDFHKRCAKGLKQTFIDPERGYYPSKRLIKIGRGGDRCLVNCCPYDRTYASLVEAIPKSLEEVGFNGYFYYLVGGFPNPTGKEIKYAGVPYCFKVLAMHEAYLLGFNNVLWIDSSILPVRDITPVFEKLEKEGCFLLDYINPSYNKTYIFPKTRELLQKITGTDVVESRHISTQVFGLKMNAEKTKQFVDSYYKLLELGTPFLSCFPEEFVFASLFQKNPNEWPSQFVNHVIGYHHLDEEQKEIQQVKLAGQYFYLRRH